MVTRSPIWRTQPTIELRPASVDDGAPAMLLNGEDVTWAIRTRDRHQCLGSLAHPAVETPCSISSGALPTASPPCLSDGTSAPSSFRTPDSRFTSTRVLRRARRRYLDMRRQGIDLGFDAVLEDLRRRDERCQPAVSPLLQGSRRDRHRHRWPRRRRHCISDIVGRARAGGIGAFPGMSGVFTLNEENPAEGTVRGIWRAILRAPLFGLMWLFGVRVEGSTTSARRYRGAGRLQPPANLDPLLIEIASPGRFTSWPRKSCSRSDLGWLLRRFGNFRSPRGKSDRRAVRFAIATLRHGLALGMFRGHAQPDDAAEQATSGRGADCDSGQEPGAAVAVTGSERMPFNGKRPPGERPIRDIGEC